MAVGKLCKIKRNNSTRNKWLVWKLRPIAERHSNKNSLPISMKLLGSSRPEFGRTQYRFGAVVLILNRIGLSVGFFNSMCEVMAWLNGPANEKKKKRGM